MVEIKAPSKLEFSGPSIFLAGSIEMGSAEDWQAEIITKLDNFDITILNPRRDDWDSSWEQSINDPNFKKQVVWELEAQEKSDYIIMYFDPNTKSPISLLELGLFATTGKMIVVCPEGFWRKGNVDIVCERYNVLQANNIDDAIEILNWRFLYK